MQSIPRTLGIAVSAYWLFARHTYFQVNRKGNIQKNRLTSAHPEALPRSEEHTSELQSQSNLVCRLLLEKKNRNHRIKGFNGTSPLPWTVTLWSPSGVSNNTVPVRPYATARRVSNAFAPSPTPVHCNRTT